jgi:hypothetical protein
MYLQNIYSTKAIPLYSCTLLLSQYFGSLFVYTFHLLPNVHELLMLRIIQGVSERTVLLKNDVFFDNQNGSGKETCYYF